MGADLYESYYGSILATLALGAAAAVSVARFQRGCDHLRRSKLAVAPLALAGLGIISSVLGIFTVRTKEDATFAQLLKSLHFGVNVASVLIIDRLVYRALPAARQRSAMASIGVPWWQLGI